MAKAFNLEVVEKEFDKLDLEGQIVFYERLGKIIHDKICEYQEGLSAKIDKFQVHKEKLNGSK